MVRKLALAVSIALGTLNVPAHALGLGELSSKSQLNQNFSGDITLLSVSPEELDGIRVKLADTEAFSRAGVARPFYLSLLRFEPTLTNSGSTVIRVSSEFPIREPFINFLVEVNWPNGRLLREYTVLLDPPTTTMRRPPQPAAATVQPRPAPRPTAPVVQRPTTVAPTPAPQQPVVAMSATEYGPVQANETAWSIAKKVRPGGVSMEQMMMSLLTANPEAFVDGNINLLRRGRILRVPALDEIQQTSRQQARQAYREQQDEWLARRDARMQAAVAEPDEPAGEAAVEADDQLRIATSRPEGDGEAGAGEDDATQTTAPDLQSRLIVARENAETSRQEAETLRSEVDDLQARLADMQKLLSLKDEQLARLQDQVVTGETEVPPGEVSDQTTEAVDEAVDTEDLIAEPAAEAAAEVAEEQAPQTLEAPAETASEALDEVLADLESAVSDVMADDPTAAATSSDVPPPGYTLPDVTPLVDVDAIVEGRAPAVAPVEEFEVTPLVDVDAIVEGRLDPNAAADAVAADSEPPVAAEAVDEIVIEPDGAAEVPAEVTVAAPIEPPVPADDVAASEPAPVVVESEASETAPPAADEAAEKPQVLPPALASLVENNIVPIAGGGVALLGLIGWLATRRRKQESAEKPVAAPVAPSDDLPGVDEPAVAADTLDDLPDSAFLDEFSPNDINSLQDETGEVDPVSEADVYIAYGRYQQAQELLNQALERDPDRLSLKHKLLEVHYATRDADAFAALAQDMVDAGQDVADEAAWARAQDMGRELQPANPLFASEEERARGGAASNVAAGAAVAGAVAAASTVDNDTLSLGDLDLSDLDDEYDAQKPDEEPLDAPSEVSITLDLDETTEELESVGSDLEIPDIPESLSLDDVESLSLEELDTPPLGEDDATVDGDTVSDSFDLDSMMAEAEKAIDAEDTTLNLDSDFSADELQAELDQLSDLSVLDTSSDDDDQPASVAEPPANLGLVDEDVTTTDEGLDQPIDLDEAFESADDTAAAEPLNLDTAEDASDDEDVSTKLDLARAYVEMGDDEGARSILEEVVSEGTAGQKDEANQLLAELG